MSISPISLNNVYNKSSQASIFSKKPAASKLSKEINHKNKAEKRVPITILETTSKAFLLKSDAEEFYEETKQRAQQLKQEAIDLYNGNAGYNKVSAKIDEGNGVEVVEELLNNGSTLRRNFFQDGVLVSIDEYGKNGLNKYKFYNFGNSLNFKYQEGIEKDSSGTQKIAREVLSYGELNSYSQDCRYYPDKGYYVGKQILFKDNKINKYEEGLLCYPGINNKSEIRLRFDENERPVEFTENLSFASTPQGRCRVESVWTKENGIWTKIN